MKKLSMKRRDEAKGLLQVSRIAQAEFWKSLSDLESCLRIEIESTIDFQDTNIEDLLDPISKRAILGYPERNPYPLI